MVISWYVNELIKKLHQTYPNKERSGIARVQKRDGYYEVTDIRFPKQSNHWAETEMKDWGLDILLEDIFTQHPEQLVEWKCRLHSHHSMWCFWSWTDEATKTKFNDGNMDYRWSIVTAYSPKWIDYKCALNIFKPVNMEFNIPVTQQEFDVQRYMTIYWQDINAYNTEFHRLEMQRDQALQAEEQPYEPSQEDIQKMLDIFNVEWTEDDIAVVTKLLKKDWEGNRKFRLECINNIFKDEIDILKDKYQMDYFSDKLKELADNIIQYQSPYAYAWYPIGTPTEYKSRSLFDDDMKYNNHTQKGDGLSSLSHYWYERDGPNEASKLSGYL